MQSKHAELFHPQLQTAISHHQRRPRSGSESETADGWTDSPENLVVAGLAVVGIVGVTGNFLVAFTLIRRKQLKYPSNR